MERTLNVRLRRLPKRLLPHNALLLLSRDRVFSLHDFPTASLWLLTVPFRFECWLT